MRRYVTRAVAAAAYPANHEGRSLTHTLDQKGQRVLCGRVKRWSLLDDSCATDENAPPTCPTCRQRDPRAQGDGPSVLKSLLQL